MMESQKVNAEAIRNGNYIRIPPDQVKVGMSVAVLKYKIAFIANVIADHGSYFEFHGGWKCEKYSGYFFIYHDCDLGI